MIVTLAQGATRGARVSGATADDRAGCGALKKAAGGCLVVAHAAGALGPGPSVIGLDDLRRCLDDENFFAAVRIDLDQSVKNHPPVVLHGDDAVDEDIVRE